MNKIKNYLLLGALIITPVMASNTDLNSPIASSSTDTLTVTNNEQQSEIVDCKLIESFRANFNESDRYVDGNYRFTQTEETKKMFSNFELYLEQNFKEHQSYDKFKNAIDKLRKNNKLNTHSLLVVSIAFAFSISDKHDENFEKGIKSNERGDYPFKDAYNYFRNNQWEKLLESENEKDIYVFSQNDKDSEELDITWLSPYVIYPVFGEGEFGIKELTKAYLNNIFPIAITKDQATEVHGFKMSPGQFAFHDLIHAARNSFHYQGIKRCDMNNNDKKQILDNFRTIEEKFKKNFMLELFNAAEKLTLNEKESNHFWAIMFETSHEISDEAITDLFKEINKNALDSHKLAIKYVEDYMTRLFTGREKKVVSEFLSLAGYDANQVQNQDEIIKNIIKDWVKIAEKLLGVEEKTPQEITPLENSEGNA